MKKPLIACLLLLVSAGVAALSLKPGHAQQTPPTTFPLSVGFDPSIVPQGQSAAFQAVQNALNGSTALPANRTTFFSGYTQAAGYMIGGWTAMITSVQPNANGYLATLLVRPSLLSPIGLDTIIVDLAYFEQYQVSNGAFAYVDSLDPNGQAGSVTANVIGL